MCWNKEVSMATYITVIVLVVILYRRNIGADRHLAIFSAAFVTIQLLEFFAWLSIEKKDRKLNDLVTRLILIFLWSQPLVNSYMGLKGASSKTGKFIMLLAVIVFVMLFLGAIVTALRGTFETRTGPNCHLVWYRKPSPNKPEKGNSNGFMADYSFLVGFYLVGLFLPLLFIRPFRKGLALSVLGLGLLLISRKMGSKEEFSSWWCWIAGVFTLAALIYKTPG
jgi:heme A synthase